MNQEIQSALEKIAYQRATPFCYHCYVEVKNKKSFKISLLSFFLLALFLLNSFFTHSDPFLYEKHGFVCVLEILLIGIPPAALLFHFVRRAAVLDRMHAGIAILLSGISFGLFGTELICADSSPVHILFWHILPSVVLVAFGALTANKFLEKI